MSSKPPAHGSSAQTAEIDIDLIAADVHEPGDPQRAEAVISVDANTALRIEISASDEPDWQLDARIVDGDVDIRRGFRERVSVFDDEIPDWVKCVAAVVGDRLEGGRV